MCLYSKENEKFAETDIVCYKVLLHDNFLGEMVTPVQKRRVPRMVLNGKRLFKARGGKEVEICPNVYYTVGGGFIHSYTKCPWWICSNSEVVYRCVIPKGTWYYESEDGSEYAARKIRFVRR